MIKRLDHMLNPRRAYVFAAVLAIIIALPVGTAFADDEEEAASSTPVADALTRDALEYASDQGIGLQEARRRLGFQGRIGQLDADLTTNKAGTFAGLWIRHGPEARVIAKFTRNGEATVLPYVTGGPLAGIVEIRTAGHCRNLTMSYDGATLSFGGAVEGGSQDVQWHIASGFTVRNWVWDGTNLRFVTSTKHRNQQAINEWVCKFGIITGYGCGYIIDKNYTKQANSCDNHPCSHYPTWIRVHRDGVDLSTHGDSGGPWFVSNTAYGTMSASLTPEDGQGNEIGPSDALYMAINYLSSAGLGITVLTE